MIDLRVLCNFIFFVDGSRLVTDGCIKEVGSDVMSGVAQTGRRNTLTQLVRPSRCVLYDSRNIKWPFRHDLSFVPHVAAIVRRGATVIQTMPDTNPLNKGSPMRRGNDT